MAEPILTPISKELMQRISNGNTFIKGAVSDTFIKGTVSDPGENLVCLCVFIFIFFKWTLLTTKQRTEQSMPQR